MMYFGTIKTSHDNTVSMTQEKWQEFIYQGLPMLVTDRSGNRLGILGVNVARQAVDRTNGRSRVVFKVAQFMQFPATHRADVILRRAVR